MNVVENTGGYYESMAIANVLPDKMKMLAEHIDANYKAMSNWYELEFVGDGRAQTPRGSQGRRAQTRGRLSIQMSTRERRSGRSPPSPRTPLLRSTRRGASAVRCCQREARRRCRARRADHESTWTALRLPPARANVSSSIASPPSQRELVRRAERHVAGGVLVEERVVEQPPRLRDRRAVRHERHLAQPAGAIVGVDQLPQHVFAALGLTSSTTRPSLEPQR